MMTQKNKTRLQMTIQDVYSSKKNRDFFMTQVDVPTSKPNSKMTRRSSSKKSLERI